MLLSAWPAFQQAYPLIDPAQRASVEIAFRALTDALAADAKEQTYRAHPKAKSAARQPDVKASADAS